MVGSAICFDCKGPTSYNISVSFISYIKDIKQNKTHLTFEKIMFIINTRILFLFRIICFVSIFIIQLFFYPELFFASFNILLTNSQNVFIKIKINTTNITKDDITIKMA